MRSNALGHVAPQTFRIRHRRDPSDPDPGPARETLSLTTETLHTHSVTHHVTDNADSLPLHVAGGLIIAPASPELCADVAASF